MAKTREILNRINSISSTKKITQAMKMVSVSKLAKSQEKSTTLSIYKNELDSIQRYIINSLGSGISSPFFDPDLRSNNLKNNALIILITSDRGLCGSFNNNIIKECNIFTKELNQRYDNIEILTIGKKGFAAFSKEEYKINPDYTELLHDLFFEKVHNLASFLFESYMNGVYSSIYLVYNEPQGKANKIIKKENFIPLSKLHNPTPSENEELQTTTDDLIIFQPEKEKIIDLLIPKLLKIKLYNSILNSVTAEHAARMMAMTKASDNADEILKELKLTYNRTRQSIITKELTEIVGGAEALKSGH